MFRTAGTVEVGKLRVNTNAWSVHLLIDSLIISNNFINCIFVCSSHHNRNNQIVNKNKYFAPLKWNEIALAANSGTRASRKPRHSYLRNDATNKWRGYETGVNEITI